MADYHAHAKSRSATTVIVGAVAFVMGGGALLIEEFGLVGLIGGGVILIPGLVMAYSYWRNDVWDLEISAGILKWQYPPRFQPAAGSVDLRDISRVWIDGSCEKLTLDFLNGESKTIYLVTAGDDGLGLYKYLASNYPKILVGHGANMHLG